MRLGGRARWGRRSRCGRRAIAWLVAGVCAGACGCTPPRGGWDLGALEDREPLLRRIEGHRLGDLSPHFLPRGEGLTLFLCRWPTDAVIPVALPEDASDAERAALSKALRAWTAAGLGITLREGPVEDAGIEIDFVEPDDERYERVGTADTIADCALRTPVPAAGPLDATLRYASIVLRRANTDLLGRPVVLGPDELVGAAMHELGHALGLSGHVVRDRSLMSRSTASVRRWGERVNAGEPLEDATLRALYALPSGSVVGRVRLAEAPRALHAELARRARRAGLRGPLTRVGQASARVFWRNARGVPVALRVSPWPEMLSHPSRIVLEPNPPARLLLASPSPPGPGRGAGRGAESGAEPPAP